MEYPIKRHCTSFIQPCITISWENFPLFLEKLKKSRFGLTGLSSTATFHSQMQQNGTREKKC